MAQDSIVAKATWCSHQVCCDAQSIQKVKGSVERSFCIDLACQYIDCMIRTMALWYKYTQDFSLSLPNHPRVENPPILRRKFNAVPLSPWVATSTAEFPPFQNAVVSAHPGCEEVIAVLRNLCAMPERWNMSLLCVRMISIPLVLRIIRIQLPLSSTLVAQGETLTQNYGRIEDKLF